MQANQPVAGPSTAASSSSSAGKPDRLFVGNLSPTVDEYALLQVFGKYGKVTKLDFMFHKSGVLKGKPRGYAFVEFLNKDDALKAMVKLHDRLLRGRKLVVTYANSAPVSDLPLPLKGRRSEPAKTTTLSLLKSRRHPQSASAQIAAMEAKLASMAKTKPADEDYVPGTTAYRGTPSGNASPAPEELLKAEAEDNEGFLGAAEADEAAQELEREMQLELIGGAEELKPDISGGEENSAAAAPQPASATAQASSSTTGPVGEKGKAREEAFKRGLAGLPKKPAF